MGFTVAVAVEAGEAVEAAANIPSESDIMDDETDEESGRQEVVAARTEQPPPRAPGPPPIPVAIAINDNQTGQLFWRTLTSQVDTTIKANRTAHVIPSAHTIAMEVIRHGQEINVEEHGVGVSRERWTDHTTVSDNMDRDFGLAYLAVDDEGYRIRKR